MSNLATAYNEWEQMAKRLKDFQSLGDVLREALQAERRLEVLRVNVADAEIEYRAAADKIAALETRGGELETEHQVRVDNLRSLERQLKDEIEAGLAARRAEVDTLVADYGVAVRADIDRLTTVRGQLQLEVDQAAQDLQKLRVDAGAEQAEAQAKLDKINREIEKALRRIHGEGA